MGNDKGKEVSRHEIVKLALPQAEEA